MNILQVNYSDLMGRIFNGYDLQISLNERGIQASQAVRDKLSHDGRVYGVGADPAIQEEIKHVEKRFSISHLLYPYGQKLKKMGCYEKADIVHYHILHNNFISLLDLPLLMENKTSVWTIHDPWIVTGNCVHPLQCGRWKTGCGSCRNLEYKWFEMRQDHTRQMWEIKRQIFKQINPTIVVASRFMEDYIKASPLTGHFTDIVRIPFGVKQRMCRVWDQKEMRRKFSLPQESFVIGFRSEDDKVKGCDFLYKALENLDGKEEVSLLTVGGGEIPRKIKEKFRIRELGWVNDDKTIEQFFACCDLFVMPSLAESFGLMAVEAMAAGVPVVCFKDTAVEEMIHGPMCGMAVEYMNIEELKKALEYMVQNAEAASSKGEAGRELAAREYTYELYIERHVQLYEKLLREERGKV